MYAQDPTYKPTFFKEPSNMAQIIRPNSDFDRHLCKSQSKLNVKKILSNKTQIFPKQYTNKYFRNKSLYQEKENQKLSQLNRFYGFMRKTKLAKKFKEKKIITSMTQSNEQFSQKEERGFHLLNELKFRSIKNKNQATLDKHFWFQSRQKAASYFAQDPINNQNDIKNRALKQISVSNIQNCANLPKEKISTSRALQKYAKLIKQEIFHSSKSHIFDRSPIKRQRSQHYRSNIETKQMILCTKNLKNESYHSRQFNRSTKFQLTKQKAKTISQFSTGLDSQNFDINGWQTNA